MKIFKNLIKKIKDHFAQETFVRELEKKMRKEGTLMQNEVLSKDGKMIYGISDYSHWTRINIDHPDVVKGILKNLEEIKEYEFSLKNGKD